MKIIGKTDAGFLLEANSDEIANLLGYYSDYQLPERGGYNREKLQIGDQVNVAAMFKHLRELEHAGKEMTNLASKLRTAADLIDTLPAPLTAVKAEPDQPASP